MLQSRVSRVRVGAASRPRALSSPALLQSPVSLLQSNSFWHHCGKRHDWTSHLDPIYHRFTRYRTLKTRAKLLASFKRRSKFNWDAEQRPFFTSRQLRFASHWGCNPRGGRWIRFHENDDCRTPSKSTRPEADVIDGKLELSKRERLWREQVDALKKRLEHDPYETVFGKRFEPFWTPMVPSWLKNDMHKQLAVQNGRDDAHGKEETSSRVKNDRGISGATKPVVPASTVANENSSRPAVEPHQNHMPKTYSCYSSTSWDSLTQRSRRTTWDSLSGQTKRFEYDPISNRMVQVEGHGALSQHVEGEAISQAPNTTLSTDSRSAGSATVDVPTLKSTESRTSVRVPTFPGIETHRPLDMANLINDPTPSSSSNSGSKSLQAPAKLFQSPALAKMPKDDLDLLTVEDVRASMGKVKSSTKTPDLKAREQLEKAFDEASRAADHEGEAILNGKTSGTRNVSSSTAWSIAFPENHCPPHKVTQSSAVSSKLQNPRLQTSLDRRPAGDTVTSESKPLQSAVQRMQSKQLPVRDISVSVTNDTPSSVPQNWQDQASLLQAERVKRASSKRPYPMTGRIKDMEVKHAEHVRAVEMPKVELSTEDYKHQQRKIRAREILDTEISNQKLNMQAHEEKWKHHVVNGADKSSIKTDTRESEMKHQTKALDPEILATTKQQQLKDMQGEGDFCLNVTKFAKSDEKWYKQPTNGPPAEILERAAQKANDHALVSQVREIYENEYGTIDVNHRQSPRIIAATSNDVKSCNTRIHDEHELGDALAAQEQKGQYRWKQDNLEAELAQQERQASIGSQQQANPVVPKFANERLPQAAPTAVAKSSHAQATSTSKPSMTALAETRWQEPSLYKILAYDSGNDRFSTATTTSNFTGNETPISIPRALSELYQPARFVPHFERLQEEGFQVIYGTKDLLVFKKVFSGHSRAEQAPSSSVPDAVSSDEIPSPGLDAVEQHGQSAVKASTSLTAAKAMKPVDGTGRKQPLEQQAVPTGNFASPTGFVNHDLLFVPREEERSVESSMPYPDPMYGSSLVKNKEFERADGESGGLSSHCPSSSPSQAVKREESVFTGTRRVSSNGDSSALNRRVMWEENGEADDLAWRNEQRQDRRGEWRQGFWKGTLLSGSILVGTSYLVGQAVEAHRREDQERMERINGTTRTDQRLRRA